MNVYLASCGTCENDVYVSDVVRHARIPKAHGFVALEWLCSECGMHGKMATSVDDWVSLEREYQRSARRIETMIAEFAKDLDVLVQDSGDILGIWRSLGAPPVEVRPGKGCECITCKQKRREQGVFGAQSTRPQD